jgi:hypothetical protein
VQITRNSLETAIRPGDWFSGAVYIDTVATASEPSRLQAAGAARAAEGQSRSPAP